MIVREKTCRASSPLRSPTNKTAIAVSSCLLSVFRSTRAPPSKQRERQGQAERKGQQDSPSDSLGHQKFRVLADLVKEGLSHGKPEQGGEVQGVCPGSPGRVVSILEGRGFLARHCRGTQQ